MIDGAETVVRKLAMSFLLAACCASSSLAQSDAAGCNQQQSTCANDDRSNCQSELMDLNQGCGDDCHPTGLGGHYFSVFGGFVDIDNFERTLVNGTNTNIDGAKLHDDWTFGASFGKQVHRYARCEFELTCRDNEVSKWFEQEFDNSGVLVLNNVTAATGSVKSYSGVFNILFDFADRCVGCPALYLGAGLGAIYVDADFATAANSYEAADSSFAYQFIGGVNYPLSQRVDLFTEYRYLGADYLTVDDVTAGQSLGDFNFDSNSIFFGARFRR